MQSQAGPGWYAAHAKLKKRDGEPQVQGHTNPVFAGNPAPDSAIRATLAARREAELNYYNSANPPIATGAERRQFFEAGEEASKRFASR